MYTEQQMVAIGGKVWEKGTTRRVYFNQITDLAGLTVEYHGTGNVRACHDRIGNVNLSNSAARRIMASKVYWQDGELIILGEELTDPFYGLENRVRDAIAARVATLADS